MMSLVERGLAKRHKRGTYLIERRDAEDVLTALRQWI
jgi:predicted transcriptional regulator of viral defense system